MAADAATLLDLQLKLQSVGADVVRRQHAKDPVRWAKDRLGVDLWSAQRHIVRAVAKYRRVCVLSCHEAGKSHSAAITAGWWIDTHAPGTAFCVTTAPTDPQVKAILWREIGRMHAQGKLPGRVNQSEWYLRMPAGNEELVAFGRKPSDYDVAAFQGIHADHVLVVMDEANGIADELFDAADSLIANDTGKMLLIGNPDVPAGKYYRAAQPGSGWYVIQVGAFDTPNFTGEAISPDVARRLIGKVYVEEKRREWAKTWTWNETGARVVPPPGVSTADLENTHPFWQSKVLGQFPIQRGLGSLIPLPWILAAQQRTLRPGLPQELGLDVGASEDGDPSCLGWRRGDVFRVLYEDRQPDTMITTGKLLLHLHDAAYGATRAKVDYIGVGRGVVDRAREQEEPVYPISVGEAGTRLTCKACHHTWDIVHGVDVAACPACGSDLLQKVFANLLSQLWWDVRTRFEHGQIDLDPDDEDLAAQLVTLRWEPNSKGQIVVKYGDGPSPNRADALLLSFAPLQELDLEQMVVW